MGELRVVRGDELSPQTSQTPGMHRLAAIAADTVGARNLWVGRVTLAPGARSGAHHHGDCESVICVTAGRIRFRYGERLENSAEAGPGDFIYVPPRLVHQETNLSETEGIDSIVVRDSQENVVVNVEPPEG
ncbi:MAG TPA: cupin domain-containing protein [Dehalococcoidia bacterium]|nr:cupin domain-containing protein [Dehalococcoidia bacterium]